MHALHWTQSFGEFCCTWLVGARSQKIKVEEVEPQSLPELLCKTLQDMEPAHTRMTLPVTVQSMALCTALCPCILGVQHRCAVMLLLALLVDPHLHHPLGRVTLQNCRPGHL